MTEKSDLILNITQDDLSQFASKGPAFVTMGETMIRDTPADQERLERTRQVWLSLAGSEFTLAITLSRLGIPSEYITRLPDNPYGWMLRNIAREQDVNVDHLVWVDKGELMGRLLYELGRTPRAGVGWYQRRHSAASMLGTGMVNWEEALRDAKLFHTSGITFGLSAHSRYNRNYLLDAFQEAISYKSSNCLVGIDFNYRSTLWSIEQCKQVMMPLISQNVDVMITTIEDMAIVFGMSCGRSSAEDIDKGDFGEFSDAEVQEFLQKLIQVFNLKVAAITIRYPDTHEQHRWESAAMNSQGYYFRSPMIQPIVLMDRLGGGDTWNGGFYYGILTESDPQKAIQKGVLVGDAATRLKQTLMYDLPIVTKQEIQARLKADTIGGGKRTLR